MAHSGHRIVIAALLAVAVALTSVGVSGAASSRKDFVKRVDPVCLKAQKKAKKTMRRAAPRNHARGKAYSTVARIGRAAIADIYRIGPQPADLVLYDRWIQKLQRENHLTVRVARSLKSGHPNRAKKLYRKAADANRRSEKIVRSFGFKHCDRSIVGTP